MSVRKSLNNIFVTCGTSQLAPNKLVALGSSKGELESAIGSPEVCNQFINQLITHMASHWSSRESSLGDMSSCFGAEIHTLTALEKRTGENKWDPKRDQLIILASDTDRGQLAAKIIREVSITLWGVPIKQVEYIVVSGLTENPSDPDSAMGTLANIISEYWQEPDDKITWHNIFAATGGFKSTLPCLTVFSLFYGIELIYLFEQSKHLQKLHPRYNFDSPQSRKFWAGVWEDMARYGWMGEEVPLYMRIALQGRLERPAKSFIG